MLCLSALPGVPHAPVVGAVGWQAGVPSAPGVGAVVWLAGPGGRFTTGQTLHINGGAYLGT